MFTFLLISCSSSWICEAFRSCWFLKKRLLVASSSCISFTFSSLFMAANLQRMEQCQQPVLLYTIFFYFFIWRNSKGLKCLFTLPSAVLVFPLLVPGCFCAVPLPSAAAPAFKSKSYDSLHFTSIQRLHFICWLIIIILCLKLILKNCRYLLCITSLLFSLSAHKICTQGWHLLPDETNIYTHHLLHIFSLKTLKYTTVHSI